MKIDSEILKKHNLTEEEYKKIVSVMGREPNLVELGIFSVMWSEHCSYKSSRKYLKNLPTKGPKVLQGPGENAGVIDIGDGDNKLALVFKIESHNHPSFIEPFHGAATGVGGILRDVFTMGARPIANLNSIRFGEVTHPKTSYLVSGVVSGIAAYGNCMGIPTVAGEVFFDACYNGNNLVNAMTVGVVHPDKIFKGIAKGVGNPVMYIGSKTGRDGIHGATMASARFGGNAAPSAFGGRGPHPPKPLSLPLAKLDVRSPDLDVEIDSKRPTVQVGDPFTEKLLLEACLELMETDAIVGIQDMGAAGLTSSSVEMAARGGSGLDLHLDQVPLREEGMTPYEIMLSESQERMLLVAQKGKEDIVKKICDKWDLDASVIGVVTEDHHLRLHFQGEEVAVLPVDPLTNGAPVYDRPVRRPKDQDDLNKLELSQIPLPENLETVFKNLISSPNLASKKWVYRQYDHQVMTQTSVLPGSDAAVCRIHGTQKAVAMKVDCNARYCYLDPKTGAMIAVAESVRNIVCSGGKPAALTNCLNFGNPERPEIMWQFSEAVAGMSEACRFFEIPVISGNVSFYNETFDHSIYPTPVIGMVGLLDSIDERLDQFFKKEGDVIILLGETKEELGGSEYLKTIHGLTKGLPPNLSLESEKNIWKTLWELNDEKLIHSAHDCSDGGLAVALAESSFNEADLGVTITLNDTIRSDALLFGESQSRVVVSADPKVVDAIKVVAKKNGVPCSVLGLVTKGNFKISLKGSRSIDLSLANVKEWWENGFEEGVF